MSKKSIRVFGNPQNFTGYGNATQSICLSLDRIDIPKKYIFSGPNKDFIKKLKNSNCNPSIDLYIHTPPFSKHLSKNYKIGYFYWEADRLPKIWGKDINRTLNEVWAPCNLVKEACLKAGFKGPIKIIPTPSINPVSYEEIQIPSKFKDLVLDDNIFKFYSIFQWNERKGYNKLIRGYYEEFSSKDNVILILKVNPIKHSNHGVQKITNDILKIKSLVKRTKKDLPKIFVSTDYVDRATLDAIHHTCDAFVLPHHGEGWGMPIHDAVNHQNFIITTKFGGITEWLNDDNSFVINHNLIPVKKMDWNPWYDSYQNWANPSLSSLKQCMRFCFDKHSDLNYKRQNLKNIINLFTLDTCAANIKKALDI